MTSGPASNAEPLQIRELRPDDLPLLATFDCGDPDLNGFLRDDAARLGEQHVVRPYVALIGEALVGYLALMADAVRLQTPERKKLRLGSADHPWVPAVKVARLAVAKASQRRGLGVALMRFAVAKAYEAGEYVGCRLLTLDSYQGAIEFYRGLGFAFNKASDYRGHHHPSMRLDLYAPKVPAWVTGGSSTQGPA